MYWIAVEWMRKHLHVYVDHSTKKFESITVFMECSSNFVTKKGVESVKSGYHWLCHSRQTRRKKKKKLQRIHHYTYPNKSTWTSNNSFPSLFVTSGSLLWTDSMIDRFFLQTAYVQHMQRNSQIVAYCCALFPKYSICHLRKKKKPFEFGQSFSRCHVFRFWSGTKRRPISVNREFHQFTIHQSRGTALL